MTSRTLFDAFTAAQTTHRPAARNQPEITDDTMLEALRHSVTDRDQLMQRRVRFNPDGNI